MKSCATWSSVSLISRLYCVRRSILLSMDRPPLAGPRPTQLYTLSCWPLTIKYCGVVYSLHTSKKTNTTCYTYIISSILINLFNSHTTSQPNVESAPSYPLFSKCYFLGRDLIVHKGTSATWAYCALINYYLDSESCFQHQIHVRLNVGSLVFILLKRVETLIGSK